MKRGKKKPDPGATMGASNQFSAAQLIQMEMASELLDKKKQVGSSPYPHKFQSTMQLPQYHSKYSTVEPGGFADAVEGVAGESAALCATR